MQTLAQLTTRKVQLETLIKERERDLESLEQQIVAKGYDPDKETPDQFVDRLAAEVRAAEAERDQIAEELDAQLTQAEQLVEA